MYEPSLSEIHPLLIYYYTNFYRYVIPKICKLGINEVNKRCFFKKAQKRTVLSFENGSML